MSYVDQLERELVRAGQARRRHRPRVTLGGVTVTAAAALSLALAVLAIALIGHRAPVTPGDQTSAIPPAARGLVSALAVLWRPQTAADRALPASGPAPYHGGAIVASLTRLAVSAPGLKVFVVVSLPGRGPGALWPATLGDQVSLVVQTAQSSTRTVPVPFTALRDPGLARNVDGYVVELVPDGVTRVRWGFAVKTGIYRLTGRVVANVAFDHFGPAAARPGPFTEWFRPDGHAAPTTPNVVVRQISSWSATRHAVVLPNPRTVHYRVSPRLLENFPALADKATSTPNFTITPISEAAAAPIVGAAGQPGEPTEIDLRRVLAVRTRTGLRFWIAPGANGICIFATDGGACPDDLAGVLNSGMWDIIRAPGGTSMFVGVVPKTNTTVTFDLKGGGSRTVPVLDGLVITPYEGITVTHIRGTDGRMRP